MCETNDISTHQCVGNTYTAVTPCAKISTATLHTTMEARGATASAGAHLAMRAHSRVNEIPIRVHIWQERRGFNVRSWWALFTSFFG